MSNFAKTLQRLMDQQGVNSSELARRAKINQPKVSRFLNANQQWIDSEDLKRISLALSPDSRIHAQLLSAYLLDMCKGPGSQHIDIKIDGQSASSETDTRPERSLPPKLQTAIDAILANVMEDRKLKDIVLALGGMYPKR